MEIKSEANHIIKILSKPEHERMPFEGVQISKVFQKIPLFNRYFNPKSQTFMTLCLSSHLVIFEPKDTIYLQQQSANAIYFILEGAVKLASNNIKSDIIIQQFDHFGQTEVLFNMQHRQQNAYSIKNSKCMKLNSKALYHFFKMQESIKKCLNYLQANSYFQDLTNFQKKILVLKMQKKSFSKNQIILKQGQTIDKLIYVRNGRLTVIKELLLNQNIEKLAIDNIEEMNSYGQYQCKLNRTSEVTLIAQNSGSYYILNYPELMKSNNSIMKKIQQLAISYPTDEQIRFIFEIQMKLRQQQRKVTQQIFRKKKIN